MSVEQIPAGTAPRAARTRRAASGLPRGEAGETSLPTLRAALLAEVAVHHPQADLGPVERAFDFAVAAHGDQRRATGEVYVTHPIAAARTLAEMALDPASIQAALLHDVPEDTDQSLADIEEHFGAEVAHLVDGVTKLSKFSTHSHEEQQAEDIRKMLLAMAEDIRVVLIKLADRLHNMRTIAALPREKQERIARQTTEIYAPLAERLGIWQIKWELEDLSFKVLEPDNYRRLAEQLETHRREREAYVKRAMVVLHEALTKSGIKSDISGRPK